MPSLCECAHSERAMEPGYLYSPSQRRSAREELRGLVGEETQEMMIDMRAAMAGMMGGRGMMGRGGGMMDRNMKEMRKT